MKIKVKVDAGGLKGVMQRLAGRQAKEATKRAARRTAASWRLTARNKLSPKTGAAYAKGVSVEEGTYPEVRLKGTLPVMLETGFPKFDMRLKLLAGPTAKVSKSLASLQMGKRTRAKLFGLRWARFGAGARIASRLVGRYLRVPVGGDEGQVRTMSWKSKGWKHPGYAGLKLAAAMRKKAIGFFLEELAKLRK